jgi:ornithine cyclodeaminase/alanine dehydrogenase-like protein (mu-crystallin family)
VTRVLTAGDVEACLDLDILIPAVGAAMTALSEGQAQQPLRQRIFDRASGAMLACLPSHVVPLGRFAVKVVTSNWQLAGPAEAPRVSQIIMLAGMDGRFLAAMHGATIGIFRTAAASAFAASLLARRDARSLAILGCGRLGRIEARAMARVRKLERIHCFDIRPERAKALGSDLSATLGIAVHVAEDARSAVEDADIVSLATTSTEPVISAEWIRPGCHLSVLGAHTLSSREVDSRTVARARVYAESREALFAEAGDIVIPIREGLIAETHVLGEIGQVAAGQVLGRVADDDVTLFKSTGIGVQDLAAAQAVYERALRSGLGTDMDL